MSSASGYIKEVLMRVVIFSKSTLNIIELTSVSAITFGEETFTVTANGVSSTYAYEDYNVSLLW